MKLGYAAAALLLSGCALAADDRVGWRDAARCVGEVCAVEGTVVGGEDRGSTVRLFFDDSDHDISIAIIRGWLAKFPDAPIAAYQGKTIIATGAVRRFRDRVEVVVRDGGDITVVESPTPEEEPAPYSSPTPSEVEELRERVRKLERRMHELGED